MRKPSSACSAKANEPKQGRWRRIETFKEYCDASRGWMGTFANGFETLDGGKTVAPAPIAKATGKFKVVGRADGGLSTYAIGTEVQLLRIEPMHG